MRRFYRTLVASMLTSVLAATAYAQDTTQVTSDYVEDNFRIGAFAGYSRNYHKTTSDIFLNCPECGQFSSGQGSGIIASIFGELPLNRYADQYGIPLGDVRLDAYLGLGLSERGGDFGEAVTAELPVQDPNTLEYVPLRRQHGYNASLRYMNYDLGFRVMPYPIIPVYFNLGLSISTPVGDATRYTQTERILSPNGVLYPETNTIDKTVGAGIINDLNSPFGLKGGIGYPVPLSDVLSAAPEVRYTLPLGDAVSSKSWKVSALELGVAVRYRLPGEAPPPKAIPPPKREPLAIVTPKPAPQVVVTRATSEEVHIVETIVTETFPVLPYLFFDSASAIMPERYVQLHPSDLFGFSEKTLPKMDDREGHRSLEAYYNVLNIVGSRMQARPRSELVINGTTDGKELEKEGQKDLAMLRAQAIKDYLTAVWKIGDARIQLRTSNAPSIPSTDAVQEGREENRRVELSSNDDELLGPIVYERFREHTISPREMPLIVDAKSSDIAEWSTVVRADDREIFADKGKGTPRNVLKWGLNKKVAAEIASELRGKQNLKGEFIARNADGNEGRTMFDVPVNTELNPFELSRLSLIVFDFDDARINPLNRKKINHFVGRSILPTSRSRVTGSTDMIGEQYHNQELSERRAVTVRDLIINEKPGAVITEVKGIGSTNMLFTNDLPEGR
ncbi:MAG TPA: OmpA family protein, partial [Candidatus Kapabacteria bacterium]|nr:OmpA family protein [Candidatus Kapabacteria bacterium]